MKIPLPSASRHAPGALTPACPCDCGARLECIRVRDVAPYWLCDACGWCEGDDEPRAWAAAWPAPEHGLFRFGEMGR
jgi:hypothetical protein